MLKRTGIILSLAVTTAFLMGMGLPIGAHPAAADEKELHLSGTSVGDASVSLGEPDKANPRLSSHLDRLIDAESRGEAEAFAGPRRIELLDGDKVRITIECVPGHLGAVAETAGAYGIVEMSNRSLVQAVVPITSLTALAGVEGIRRVRLPWYPDVNAESEGVELIKADVWYDSGNGYGGTGVKVGILDVGFKDYDDLLGSDLPALVAVRSFRADQDIEAGSTHGTACAEIVYDIAPDAQFCLANFNTDTGFGDAVDWLISKGVSVISCSVSWAGKGPGNGTGPICDVVEDAYDADIVWAQAVGNYARKHWKGDFADADSDGKHEFEALDEDNTILVDDDDSIYVRLNWNDVWGASGNNYDLHLCDDEDVVVASGDDVQNGQGGDDDPYEWLSYTATYKGEYHIVIEAIGDPAERNLRLYSLYHELDHKVAESSFAVPADSPHAMAVGAVRSDRWDWDPAVIEDYSSRGPTYDNVTKPDLVCPTCVTTASKAPFAFCGTSAATPHAAGAAVLVRECYPSYAPEDVQSFLENSAVDVGDAGKDDVFGSGRLELPTDKVEVDILPNNNVIALAVQPPVAYKASTLAAHINSQGGELDQVFWWNSEAGYWEFWLVESEYGTNFDVVLGGAYLLHNDNQAEASTWTYWGAELPDGPGEVPLVAGWNYFGLPVIPEASYTASTMAAEINDQGGNVTEVFWWNASAGTFDFWLVVQEYGTDFDIEIGEAYLLKNLDAVDWEIE